jgi:hypothetical protein
MSPEPQSNSPVAVALIAGGVIGLATLPGLALGVAVAEGLRHRALRWTWTLPLLPLTLPLAVDAGGRGRALSAAAQRTAHGAGVSSLLSALVPFWLAVVPLAALWWKLRRDRRDRLHGGAREARATRSIGPVQLFRRVRRRRRHLAAGAYTEDGGALLGLDENGEPVRVPLLVAHAAVVGGSNTGKTNTCATLLEAHVAAGAGFVIADGKGGRDLPRTAVELGARYNRPVALWSLTPYGDPALDALRLPWNVAGDGNATEVKDRIATSEEQTEPYYKAIASNGILTAAQALSGAAETIRLDHLADLLSDPVALRARLLTLDTSAAASSAAWLAGLTDGELSGLRGMALRLRTMIHSDGGEQLLPDDQGREISLYRAIREGWLVVFTLPQGTYPDLIPHVTAYVISTINAVATTIEREGDPAFSIFFVDELSAFDGEQLAATLERARSAGIRVILATQSLSNFDSAGGPKLLHGALDNSELIVVHRQLVPESAELLAGIGGTEEAWEHTHKVVDSTGYALGWDEPGERNRRLTDKFRVHPNQIKSLPLGEAAVISIRPEFTARRVRIRRALTADIRDATARPQRSTRNAR